MEGKSYLSIVYKSSQAAYNYTIQNQRQESLETFPTALSMR